MARRWAWTAVAISSMWIAVLFVAVFAPTLETVGAAGARTTFPVAGVVAAGVAFIATIVVAAMGFRDGAPRELEEERHRVELEARLAELERRLPSPDERPQSKGRAIFSR